MWVRVPFIAQTNPSINNLNHFNTMEMKIKFTPEHLKRMQDLLLAMLMSNGVLYSKLGTPIGVSELLHQTSINQLNEMKAGLQNKISKMEAQDEWVEVDQDKLQSLRDSRELVNLIVGYKRYNAELAANAAKLEVLKTKLAEMKEDAKTPQERMAELETQIAALS